MFASIAGYLGITVLRLGIYAACAALVLGAGITIRQHYINKGWNNALVAVKKQDDRAVAAANKVEQKTIVCSEQNGYWDVITQNCKLEEVQ